MDLEFTAKQLDMLDDRLSYRDSSDLETQVWETRSAVQEVVGLLKDLVGHLLEREGAEGG